MAGRVAGLSMGTKNDGVDGSRQMASLEKMPGPAAAGDDMPLTGRKAAAKADNSKHFKFFGFESKTDANLRIVSHLHTRSAYSRKEVPHNDFDAYLAMLAKNRQAAPPSPALSAQSIAGLTGGAVLPGLISHPSHDSEHGGGFHGVGGTDQKGSNPVHCKHAMM
jgi:hypothetical protein